ncbi:MAG: TetR/AcrR family transcriptional regulator, partial [Candidatus Aegiribacteria sp.]|nr:TetR/AcrR family transcriptional regulator [Candidatus Aegiribacteria sp.]
MNKRKKQKEETVNDILRVSEDLFHEQGYEKTTIQNIAEHCGLSKGALYHHFRSKEEVLKRICYRQYIYLKETFLPIVEDSELSMTEKLRRIMTIA